MKTGEAGRTASALFWGRMAGFNASTRIVSLDPDTVTERDLTVIEAVDVALPPKAGEVEKHAIVFAG